MDDNKPLAFEAEYITYRHMKTAGTIRIELEIPSEHFQAMDGVIGQPPRKGESKYVAVALLKAPNDTPAAE